MNKLIKLIGLFSILFLAVSSAGGGEQGHEELEKTNYRSNIWSTNYDRNSCWLSLEHIYLDQLEQSKLQANLYVGRMKRFWFNQYTRFLDIKTKDMIVMLQFLQDWGLDHTISDASIYVNEKKYELVKFPVKDERSSKKFPIYLTGSESAEEIWKSIKDSQKLLISYKMDSNKETALIEITGTNFASTMYDACLEL